MGRTREAALSGASAAVAKYGSRKATMGDIAIMAGIAKATLYNHFRTRDDVYAAVVLAEIDAIAAIAESSGSFDVAVLAAATALADNAAVRRVARDEPAVLAALATPGEGPGWVAARGHIARMLAAANCESTPAAVDLVLRYLATQLLSPSAAAERAASAQLINTAVSVRVEQGAASVLVGSAGTSS
jgi:AcrR family transcriptional regulator